MDLPKLPRDITEKILFEFELDKLEDACKAYPRICLDKQFWLRKAAHDLKLPIASLRFIFNELDGLTPKERYLRTLAYHDLLIKGSEKIVCLTELAVYAIQTGNNELASYTWLAIQKLPEDRINKAIRINIDMGNIILASRLATSISSSRETSEINALLYIAGIHKKVPDQVAVDIIKGKQNIDIPWHLIDLAIEYNYPVSRELIENNSSAALLAFIKIGNTEAVKELLTDRIETFDITDIPVINAIVESDSPLMLRTILDISASLFDRHKVFIPIRYLSYSHSSTNLFDYILENFDINYEYIGHQGKFKKGNQITDNIIFSAMIGSKLHGMDEYDTHGFYLTYLQLNSTHREEFKRYGSSLCSNDTKRILEQL